MRHRKPMPTGTFVLLLLGSLSCWFLPSSLSQPIRGAVRDAFRPAQRTTLQLTQQLQTRWHSTLQQLAQSQLHIDEEDTAVAESDTQMQMLAIQNAELRAKLTELQRQTPSPQQASEPLVISSLISASTLGEERSLLVQTGMLLDVGSKKGVAPSQLVLDDIPTEEPELLLDQGSDAGVFSGQPVYTGRSVLGRIAKVSRWTSQVQSVTDANYRARAQLVHKTGEEFHFGAEGILAGKGDGTCELLHIRSSESVTVGDEVYTGGHSGALPTRMYYGRIVQAHLKPGAPHWEILIEPAATKRTPSQVCILRNLVNTHRILGH